MKISKPRMPSATLVIASIALFVGLAGGAYAGSQKIGSNQIKNNAVTTKKIANNAVNEKKLKDNSVSTNILKGDSVSTSKLQDSSVVTSKLQDNSVSESKLQPGSVSSSKLQPGSVGGSQLANITTANTTLNLAQNTSGSATATCPSGATVISGGYVSSVGTTKSFYAQESRRASGGAQAWIVGGYALGGTATVTVLAYCLTNP
jgi:hypothetical protein